MILHGIMVYTTNVVPPMLQVTAEERAVNIPLPSVALVENNSERPRRLNVLSGVTAEIGDPRLDQALLQMPDRAEDLRLRHERCVLVRIARLMCVVVQLDRSLHRVECKPKDGIHCTERLPKAGGAGRRLSTFE